MKNTIAIKYYKSPYGELVLGSFNEKLCLCDWRYRKQRESIDKKIRLGLEANFKEEESPIIEKTISQLEEYFKGERKEFDIGLETVGTSFQTSVWNALQKIPYGKTISYLELSEKFADAV